MLKRSLIFIPVVVFLMSFGRAEAEPIRVQVAEFAGADRQLAMVCREATVLGLMQHPQIRVLSSDTAGTEGATIVRGRVEIRGRDGVVDLVVQSSLGGPALDTTVVDVADLILADLAKTGALFVAGALELEPVTPLFPLVSTQVSKPMADVLCNAVAHGFLMIGVPRRAADLYITCAESIQDRTNPEGAVLRLRAARALREAGDSDRAKKMAEGARGVFRKLDMQVEEAEAEDQLAFIHLARGKRRDAEKAIGRSLAILVKVMEPSREPSAEALYGTVLNHEGDHYATQRKDRRAMASYRKAEEIQRRLGVLPRLAETLRDMGIQHTGLGEHDQAFALYDEAIAILEDFGAHRELAETWKAVAEGYLVRALYDSASAAMATSIGLFDLLHLQGDLAEGLTKAGEIYLQRELPTDALRALTTSAGIWERLGRKRALVRARKGIARTTVMQGRLQEALEHYAVIEQMEERLNLPRELLDTYRERAYTYQLAGSFDEAEEDYRRAEKGAKRMRLDGALAAVYNGFGGLCVDAGDGHRALGFYNRARKLRKRLDQKVELSLVLSNMGVAYEAVDDDKRASRYYGDALGLAREIHFALGIATGAERLGMMLARMDKPEEGVVLVREALEIRERAGTQLTLARSTYPALAYVYETMGESGEAARCFEEVARISDDLDLHEAGMAARYKLGQYYRQQGRNEESLQRLREGLEMMKDREDPVKMGNLMEEIGLTHLSRSAWGQAAYAFSQSRDFVEQVGVLNQVPFVVWRGRSAYLQGQEGMARAVGGEWPKALAAYSGCRSALGEVDEAAVTTMRSPLVRKRLSDEIRSRFRQTIAQTRNKLAAVDNLIGVARFHLEALSGEGETPDLSELFAEVRKQKGASRDREGAAVALNNLGVLMWATGQQVEAGGYLKQALKLVAPRSAVSTKPGSGLVLPSEQEVEIPHVAVCVLLNLETSSAGRTLPVSKEEAPGFASPEEIGSLVARLAEEDVMPLLWRAEMLLIDSEYDARIRRLRRRHLMSLGER